MAHRPVGTGQSFATAGVAYTSSAFNIQSSVLRLVTTDAPAFVAIGTDPIATNADYYIPANTEATLGLTKVIDPLLTILVTDGEDGSSPDSTALL